MIPTLKGGGYNQREFARRDYEGLTTENQAKLRAERGEIAKNLAKRRSEINQKLQNNITGFNNKINQAQNFVNSNKSRYNDLKNKQASKIKLSGSDLNFMDDYEDSIFNIKNKDKKLAKIKSSNVSERTGSYDRALNYAKDDSNAARKNIINNNQEGKLSKDPVTFGNKPQITSGNRIMNWVKANPKMTKGIIGGSLGAVALGGGLLAYNKYKNKKKE